MGTDPEASPLHRAATATFDYSDPAQALSGLLRLTCELTASPRAALFELDEAEAGFSPRLAHGASLSELGRLSTAAEHPILKGALTKRKAVATDGQKGSLGLPLAPGAVACAPCIDAGQTIGMLFVAHDDSQAFPSETLQTLEVLAARAGAVLAFGRQTAAQSYLFSKLSLLYQATHAITGTRDRQEAIRQTAAHLLRATRADLCEFHILEDGEGLTTRFRHQLGKSAQPSLVTLVTERGPDYPVARTVLRDLRPETISLSPPLGSGRDQELLRQEGFQAATVFPLAARNTPLGIVRLLYTQPGRRTNEQELELAQAIINIGAVGLQDAIHLETADARANQLQTLAEIGREMTSTLDLETALENAMRHAQGLLGAEACVLFLLDEAGEQLVLKASGGAQLRIRGVSIGLEEGIAGWVARNRQPLIVNDVRSNPLYHSSIDGQTGLLTSSVLCVPLETRGEVLGVIEAINHPRGAFGEEEQKVLASVASWAGIAVDNANLFLRVTEERSRLETTLVETADAVVLTDRAGRTILVNKAAGQVFRINPELATGRPAQEIFHNHPLGDLLARDDVSLPTTMEITTPSERILYVTVSEVTGFGRVAVMQDITALKQIDRMRSQLLGTAAHDLKNPLNAIRLGADLLHDAPLNDQQRKALTMMQRATDSMTNLITGLLETIRVESTANIALEPVQVNDLIRHSIEDLRILAEKKKLKIEYSPPEESLLIMGDPNRLNSVMGNLLSNAIKFTPESGQIRVDARWDDEEVVVSVADNGPGIPPDEIPRVFEHLFRGRIAIQDPNNPVEGTGLGLSLAKTVIEQHGGRIWVTSAEGRGSTFYFSLPREPTPKTGSLKRE
ncbi:MAG TPA: GAF domain-containing protein [Anaerolineales bacterium]|nr:GAF domain-containing protein [Anaerolineales bacterium]